MSADQPEQTSQPASASTPAAGAPTPAAVPTPLAGPALAPTFTRRLNLIVPGAHTDPSLRIENATLSGATATLTIPATGTLAIPVVTGMFRIKMYGAGTPTQITLTDTDGTNTETLVTQAVSGVTLSATALVCMTFRFESELSPQSFTVTVAGASGATASVEIAGYTG